MESGEAKSLVDVWLKTFIFMPNFSLSHAQEMSILLNLVDNVHLKDRGIKEDESAEHLQLVNPSALPCSDMTKSTFEGSLGLFGFFVGFSRLWFYFLRFGVFFFWLVGLLGLVFFTQCSLKQKVSIKKK